MSQWLSVLPAFLEDPSLESRVVPSGAPILEEGVSETIKCQAPQTITNSVKYQTDMKRQRHNYGKSAKTPSLYS